MTGLHGIVFLLCLLAVLPGCRTADTTAASPELERAGSDAHEAGRKIYNFRCYYCHGYSGDARTLSAAMLKPKPLDFTRARRLNRRHALDAIRNGRRGTAMQSFASVLDETEIELVADFVLAEFVQRRAPNTRYHTAENGWAGHERYAVAYPFATGAIALDTPAEDLTPAQSDGRRLYLEACISCHDFGRVKRSGAPWKLSADAGG